MPFTLRLVLGTLLASAGVVLAVLAVLGSRRRLPRNRFAGIRTAATLRSAAAFALANQVGAPMVGAAGLVGLVGGLTLLAGGPPALSWVVLAVAVAGLLVLAGAGGMLGDRAAATTAQAAPPASVCAGRCAGCDLVAGCSLGAQPDDTIRGGPGPRPLISPTAGVTSPTAGGGH